MLQSRIFRWAYNTPAREDRQILPFQMRDGDGALLLTAALEARGYRYEGPIFNFASPGPNLIPVDTSFLRPTDLILMTTRPPMDDGVIGIRRPFPRSFTTLEETLFQGPLRRWFTTCARTEIVLTAAALPISTEIARRQSIEVKQNGGAEYKCFGSPVTGKWERPGKAKPLTAAFLVYVEHAWENGPAFLAAFGMGGTDTLIWCYLLKTKFAHLLCSTPFAMAEMRTGDWPNRPESMRFADSWEITILGEAKPDSSEDDAA